MDKVLDLKLQNSFNAVKRDVEKRTKWLHKRIWLVSLFSSTLVLTVFITLLLNVM